jgi:hypothetical protein
MKIRRVKVLCSVVKYWLIILQMDKEKLVTVCYKLQVNSLMSGRCNDTEQQDLFKNMREKRSLIFYCEMRLGWAREEYTICCARSGRGGLA